MLITLPFLGTSRYNGPPRDWMGSLGPGIREELAKLWCGGHPGYGDQASKVVQAPQGGTQCPKDALAFPLHFDERRWL